MSPAMMFQDLEYKYLIPFEDQMVVNLMVGQATKRRVENKSNCKIELCRQVLNRRSSDYGWLKYNIIKIMASSETAIRVCNRLLEIQFPQYAKRLSYEPTHPTRIFTTEPLPDNSPLYRNAQRLGGNVDSFGGLNLFTCYNARSRYPDRPRTVSCPWQIDIASQKGIHFPVHKATHSVVQFQQPCLVGYRRSEVNKSTRTMVPGRRVSKYHYNQANKFITARICKHQFGPESENKPNSEDILKTLWQRKMEEERFYVPPNLVAPFDSFPTGDYINYRDINDLLNNFQPESSFTSLCSSRSIQDKIEMNEENFQENLGTIEQSQRDLSKRASLHIQISSEIQNENEEDFNKESIIKISNETEDSHSVTVEVN